MQADKASSLLSCTIIRAGIQLHAHADLQRMRAIRFHDEVGGVQRSWNIQQYGMRVGRIDNGYKRSGPPEFRMSEQ